MLKLAVLHLVNLLGNESGRLTPCLGERDGRAHSWVGERLHRAPRCAGGASGRTMETAVTMERRHHGDARNKCLCEAL